jgi:hypothetical protein
MYEFDSAGQKLQAEIPVCTCNTVVMVHGYVRCLNLVTLPGPAEPILETPRVYPYPWQSLLAANALVWLARIQNETLEMAALTTRACQDCQSHDNGTIGNLEEWP